MNINVGKKFHFYLPFRIYSLACMKTLCRRHANWAPAIATVHWILWTKQFYKIDRNTVKSFSNSSSKYFWSFCESTKQMTATNNSQPSTAGTRTKPQFRLVTWSKQRKRRRRRGIKRSAIITKTTIEMNGANKKPKVLFEFWILCVYVSLCHITSAVTWTTKC